MIKPRDIIALTLSVVLLGPHWISVSKLPSNSNWHTSETGVWNLSLRGFWADHSHNTTIMIRSLPFCCVMNFLCRQVSYWHELCCQVHFKRWEWLCSCSQFHLSLNPHHLHCFQYFAQVPGDFMSNPRTEPDYQRCGNSIELKQPRHCTQCHCYWQMPNCWIRIGLHWAGQGSSTAFCLFPF